MVQKVQIFGGQMWIIIPGIECRKILENMPLTFSQLGVPKFEKILEKFRYQKNAKMDEEAVGAKAFIFVFRCFALTPHLYL